MVRCRRTVVRRNLRRLWQEKALTGMTVMQRPGMPMANQKMQKMMILARKTALMKTADQIVPVKETI